MTQTDQPLDGHFRELAYRVQVDLHIDGGGCVQGLNEGGQSLGAGGEGIKVGHQMKLHVGV